MDKQDKIWALKDKRGDLKSARSDLQWALSDDRMELRELQSKIAGIERKIGDLKQTLNSDFDFGGPVIIGRSTAEKLESAQNELSLAVGRRDGVPMRWGITEEEITREQAEIDEDIEDIKRKIVRLKNELEVEQREKDARREERANEVVSLEGQLYRLQANEESAKGLIRRREQRIKSLDQQISDVNAKLRDLGEW